MPTSSSKYAPQYAASSYNNIEQLAKRASGAPPVEPSCRRPFITELRECQLVQSGMTLEAALEILRDEASMAHELLVLYVQDMVWGGRLAPNSRSVSLKCHWVTKECPKYSESAGW